MKRCIVWLLTLACVLCFAGCDRWTDADVVLTETGYPHGEIQIPQIFCQFQSYKTAACQYRRTRVIVLDILPDAKCIFYGTQCEKLLKIHPGKLGLGGFGTGGEQ